MNTSDSLDIICRNWAPAVKKRQLSVLEKIKQEKVPAKEQLPSWIPGVTRSPYGRPEDVLSGRVNGDSFVGGPDRKNYNAAPGTFPLIRFGEVEDIYNPNNSRGTSPAGSNLPSPLFRHFPNRASSNISNPSVARPQLSSLGQSSTKTTVPDASLTFSPIENGSVSKEHLNDPITQRALLGRLPTPTPSGADDAATTNSKFLPLDTDSANKKNSVAPQLERRMKSDGTMFVKGFRLGTIVNLSGRIAEGTIPRECLEMGGWARPDPEVFEIPMVPDELWRTLVADRGSDGKNPPPWYHRACQECMARCTANGDLIIRTLMESSGPDIMMQFLKRLQCVVWNRKFFQYEEKTFENLSGKPAPKKLFGLAPEGAKSRDLVCIFLGCSVPVILRELRVGSDHYFEFIGESYIYGMMDGEALGGKKMDELKETCEEFKLR